MVFFNSHRTPTKTLCEAKELENRKSKQSEYLWTISAWSTAITVNYRGKKSTNQPTNKQTITNNKNQTKPNKNKQKTKQKEKKPTIKDHARNSQHREQDFAFAFMDSDRSKNTLQSGARENQTWFSLPSFSNELTSPMCQESHILNSKWQM